MKKDAKKWVIIAVLAVLVIVAIGFLPKTPFALFASTEDCRFGFDPRTDYKGFDNVEDAWFGCQYAFTENNCGQDMVDTIHIGEFDLQALNFENPQITNVRYADSGVEVLDFDTQSIVLNLPTSSSAKCFNYAQDGEPFESVSNYYVFFDLSFEPYFPESCESDAECQVLPAHADCTKDLKCVGEECQVAANEFSLTKPCPEAVPVVYSSWCTGRWDTSGCVTEPVQPAPPVWQSILGAIIAWLSTFFGGLFGG